MAKTPNKEEEGMKTLMAAVVLVLTSVALAEAQVVILERRPSGPPVSYIIVREAPPQSAKVEIREVSAKPAEVSSGTPTVRTDIGPMSGSGNQVVTTCSHCKVVNNVATSDGTASVVEHSAMAEEAVADGAKATAPKPPVKPKQAVAKSRLKYVQGPTQEKPLLPGWLDGDLWKWAPWLLAGLLALLLLRGRGDQQRRQEEWQPQRVPRHEPPPRQHEPPR